MHRDAFAYSRMTTEQTRTATVEPPSHTGSRCHRNRPGSRAAPTITARQCRNPT